MEFTCVTANESKSCFKIHIYVLTNFANIRILQIEPGISWCFLPISIFKLHASFNNVLFLKMAVNRKVNTVNICVAMRTLNETDDSIINSEALHCCWL